MSRAYYAAYHWARPLLLSRGLEAMTHRGVIKLLGLHFVKNGPMPEESAAHLAHLETYRELSDYASAADFTAEQAAGEIARAEFFVESCRRVLPPGIAL